VVNDVLAVGIAVAVALVLAAILGAPELGHEGVPGGPARGPTMTSTTARALIALGTMTSGWPRASRSSGRPDV
jgi:hypothetical protein